MNHLKIILKLVFACLFISFLMGCSGSGKNKEDQNLNKETNEKAINQPRTKNNKVILFFGNSLTAGYGLDQEYAFTTLIQERLDSLYPGYVVVNAGLSGETTAGGASRIDWVLEQHIDIFVLELGGNDMLRGFDVKSTEDNLRTIVERVKEKDENIQIIIAGMQAPPNMGKDYTDRFERIYFELAKEYQTGLIPYFLQGVGGIKALNQADGIHPNEEGQKILLENIWTELKKYLD